MDQGVNGLFWKAEAQIGGLSGPFCKAHAPMVVFWCTELFLTVGHSLWCILQRDWRGSTVPGFGVVDITYWGALVPWVWVRQSCKVHMYVWNITDIIVYSYFDCKILGTKRSSRIFIFNLWWVGDSRALKNLRKLSFFNGRSWEMLKKR